MRLHKRTCNPAPLPYLDEDGGTAATRWLSRCFMLKYAFYRWTRQRIHNTLIVVDRYLRLMRDNTIPDPEEPRLESFYLPFVTGIDLPQQCVLDYNPPMPWMHRRVCEAAIAIMGMDLWWHHAGFQGRSFLSKPPLQLIPVSEICPGNDNDGANIISIDQLLGRAEGLYMLK